MRKQNNMSLQPKFIQATQVSEQRVVPIKNKRKKKDK